MNFVLISPDFPPNYKCFAIQLKAQGINVLGIGSEFYDNLDRELKESMTEYYRVDNIENYNLLLKACGYLTSKYGKIDRIESNNGYWLKKDAQLRTDFNVYGIKNDQINSITLKSEMKKIFKEADLPYIQGRIISTLDDAKELVSEIKYPVIAKPNDGRGSVIPCKITNDTELMDFFNEKDSFEYILEDFIQGKIQTFDGLTDQDGNIVFYSSMAYKDGLMETIRNDLDSIFYIQNNIPEDLIKLGKKTVESFQIKERFFHIEFFRLDDGSLVLLDVNSRPPRGHCLDAMNYAYDTDLYSVYASMVNGKRVSFMENPKFHCAYIGLKTSSNTGLVHSLEEALKNYADIIAFYGLNPPIFRSGMGDCVIILKSDDEESIKKAEEFITLREI